MKLYAMGKRMGTNGKVKIGSTHQPGGRHEMQTEYRQSIYDVACVRFCKLLANVTIYG